MKRDIPSFVAAIIIIMFAGALGGVVAGLLLRVLL
jgi:hypothetical protein